MSTILVELVIANGVADDAAGFAMGATVTVAEDPAAAKFKLTLGNSAVAGIEAAVLPAGMLATREAGLDPTETETGVGVTPSVQRANNVMSTASDGE